MRCRWRRLVAITPKGQRRVTVGLRCTIIHLPIHQSLNRGTIHALGFGFHLFSLRSAFRSIFFSRDLLGSDETTHKKAMFFQVRKNKDFSSRSYRRQAFGCILLPFPLKTKTKREKKGAKIKERSLQMNPSEALFRL